MNLTEQKILACLLQREDFFREVFPFLDSSYFESKETRTVYGIIDKYANKYKKRPNLSVLTVTIEKMDLSEQAYDSLIDTLSEIKNTETKDDDFDWLKDTTEKWCQDRAVYNAIRKSIDIIDGSDTKTSKDALPEILRKALSVHFDRSVGHDFIENSEERWRMLTAPEHKIPFDLTKLNQITNGGVSRKTMQIVMAMTNAGKSIFLCHLAASYFMQGMNVLFITCEMAEERIAERIDANLLNTDLDLIKTIPLESYKNKIEKVKAKTTGRLIIKEFPTGVANVNHMRHLIEELEIKKNFKPDVICVDYLNICASTRYRESSGANSYTMVKAIAEELRGLAVEKNVVLWTATQTNRTGANNTDPDMTDVSDSFGLPMTADFMVSLSRTEELDQLNQVMMKQLKNRYSDRSVNVRFVLGLDRPKMTFYDVSDSAQQNISGSGQTPPNAGHGYGHNPNKPKENPDFSEFSFDDD